MGESSNSFPAEVKEVCVFDFLQAQLRLQEAEKSRQQELLYAIDFQCQAMQRKVSRVSGYKSAAETKALQKQIKELQAVRLHAFQHKHFPCSALKS